MVVFKGALSGMHTLLDRDVPRMNAMMKRMTEHLDAYLRGGDEPERLREILGTASMARGGEEADGAAPGRETASDAAEPDPEASP